MSALLDALLTKYQNRLPAAYITAVIGLAESNTDRRFLNDSDVHASLLIDCMIGESDDSDEIRIYSGTLKAECFSDVLSASKNHRIRILVDDYSRAKGVLESLVSDKITSHITMLPVTKEFENHFYTVGNKHFRFELDHKKASAIANFNEPKTVAKLNKRFDEMWQSAETISDQKELNIKDQSPTVSA